MIFEKIVLHAQGPFQPCFMLPFGVHLTPDADFITRVKDYIMLHNEGHTEDNVEDQRTFGDMRNNYG